MDIKDQRWARVTGRVLTVVLVLVAMSFVLAPRGERLGLILSCLVFLGVGLVLMLVPGVRSAIGRIVVAYLWFTAWMLLFVGPLLLARWVSDLLLASDSSWLRILTLTAWGLLLVTATGSVMYGPVRERMFDGLIRVGVLAPLLYGLVLLMIAIQFFATTTFLLHSGGRLVLELGSAGVLSLNTTGDFFLWHFLSAVPVLDIPETLLWDESPLVYAQARTGWILLAFKIVVIVPVITAFAWSWSRFRRAPTGPASGSARAK